MINSNGRFYRKIWLLVLLSVFVSTPVHANVLLKTIKGHSGTVNVLSFSPNGKILASIGGLYGKIKLWDVRSGNQIITFKGGHLGSGRTIVFSPDGKRLVSGGGGIKNKLWDVKNGELITTLGSSRSNYTSSPIIAFSPDGKTLVSTSIGATLWDIDNNKLITTLKRKSGIVSSLAFSPDGKILATGSANEKIKKISLWDFKSQRLITTLKGQQASVCSLAFSPDGRILASRSSEKTIKLWNVENGSLIATIIDGQSDSAKYCIPTSLVFSPDGKKLYSNDIIWDVEHRKLIATIEENISNASSFSFSPDRKTLASGGDDGVIKLWNVKLLNEEALLSAYNLFDKQDLIALHDFYNKYKNLDFSISDQVINDIVKIIKKKNTIKDYMWFVDKYPASPHTNDVIENIYKIILNENNLTGNAWFISRYPHNSISKTALREIHKLAYAIAESENTINAYNNFIIVYPYAKQVNDALTKSYVLEEEKFSGWFSNDEKNSRALRVKMEQLSMEIDDFSNSDFHNGYLIVLNRMSQLLQNRFPSEEATLRYLESNEFKEFHHTYKNAKKYISDISLRILDDTKFLDDTVLMQQSTAMKSYISKVIQPDEMAVKYKKQEKYWDQYLNKHRLNNTGKQHSKDSSTALELLKSSLNK